MFALAIITIIVAGLSGALAMAIMALRDSRARERALREELRRRDAAERAARSLKRWTQPEQTEIRTKVA